MQSLTVRAYDHFTAFSWGAQQLYKRAKLRLASAADEVERKVGN